MPRGYSSEREEKLLEDLINLVSARIREDLISYGGLFSPNGTVAVQIISGVPGKKIKVWHAGFHALVDGNHYFYFGTDTTPPTLPANKVFLISAKLGHYRQTFTQPQIGAAGDGLYFFSSVSETNMPIDVGYVQEA